MTWSVVAYYENINTGNSLTPIAAVSDSQYTVSGDDVIVKPEESILLGAIAMSSNMTRAQLRKPQFGQHHLEIPFGNAWNELLSSVNVFGFDKPRKLTPNEALNAYVAENAGADVAEDCFAFVWLGKQPNVLGIKQPYDYILKLTGSTTLTAKMWTTVSLTPETQLPEGVYEIVGFIPISAGVLVARIIDPNSAHRPGVLGIRSVSDWYRLGFSRVFPFGRFGVKFRPRSIPNVEYFSQTADTAQTVYWFLKKVG